MEAENLAIKFLGISLIILIIGIILFVLALLDYNTYIKYESSNKKIEVIIDHKDNSKKITL